MDSKFKPQDNFSNECGDINKTPIGAMCWEGKFVLGRLGMMADLSG